MGRESLSRRIELALANGHIMCDDAGIGQNRPKTEEDEMLDTTGHLISQDHRAGRMLMALITSGRKNGKLLLTTDITDARGASRLHQTFAVKCWTGRDNIRMLTVEVDGSGDWEAGIKAIKMFHIDSASGRVLQARDDRNSDPLLRYAAEAAVSFAWVGEAGLPTPANGTVNVVEADTCACCGRKLTDPESIARGIGPECAGRATGTRTIRNRNRSGQATLTEADVS